MKKKIFSSFVALLLVVVAAVCLVSCAKTNTSTVEDEGYKGRKEKYAQLNATALHDQIVMIGDSIVDFYPTEMIDTCSLKVYNRGISGEISQWLLNRLTDGALSLTPQILSVLIGTNDLGKQVDKAVTVENMKQILLKAKAGGVKKIIIQSIYPINDVAYKGKVGTRCNADIIALNIEYQRLCAENGAIYVDVYSHLTDKDGSFAPEYTYDGLHPSLEGYKVINAILKPLFEL